MPDSERPSTKEGLFSFLDLAENNFSFVQLLLAHSMYRSVRN
jgi:hypothetical protein